MERPVVPPTDRVRSSARVTSSVRVRYLRPVIFTPGTVYIHDIFTAA